MFKKIAAGVFLFALTLAWVHHNVAHAELKAVSSQGGGGSGGGFATLTTTGSSGAATTAGTNLNIPVYSGAGSSALSSITSATTTNSIDNTLNAQTWLWSTATSQNPLSLTATSLTSGSVLTLTTTAGAKALTVTGNASLSGTTTLGTVQIAAGNATLTALTASTITGTTYTGANMALTGTMTAALAQIAGGAITGTTFNNGVIGGTTSAAGTFTTITDGSENVTGSGAPANGIYLPAASTLGLTANSIPTIELLTLGSGVDYFTFTSGKSGTTPLITVAGATANQGLNLSTTGTGTLELGTGAGARAALELLDIGSGVDYITITEGKSGTAPKITVNGTTANQGITLTSTGTGVLTLSGANTLSGTTTISGALNITATIGVTGIVAGTVSGSQYMGVNSSGQVVYAAGGSGAAFTPALQPLSMMTTDTAGNVTPYNYFDGTTTGAVALGAPAWSVAASLGADTVLRWRFMMPPTLPASGTLNLCSICQANATSGVVKYTVTDADIATNNSASVGATVQNSETQTSITWTAADDYVTTCTPLTETPTANHISAGSITFNHTSWTLATILACNFVERWQ